MVDLYNKVVEEIKSAKHIVITAHKSPDGDSVGSSLGLLQFIKSIGKEAIICHPDPTPDYLEWLEDVEDIITVTNNEEEVKSHFEKADLIFCLDYNATNRVGEVMQGFLEGSNAKKIMIDHHLNPEDFPFIKISDTSVCSTCQLITELIVQSGNQNLLNEKIGTPLYLGILTDTGSFRFPSVQPRTHELLAQLLAAGVKHHIIHETLNDNNTINRLRLQGYTFNKKLEYLDDYKIALISLTEEELKEYHYKKGDTEGFVNIALSIKGTKAAVFLSEKDGLIKMSFRSKGSDNPVNVLASENFDGGGHANASGGASKLTMNETIDKLKQVIPLYFNRIN